jgi:hypothetical protein
MKAEDIVGYLAWSLGMNPNRKPVGLAALTGIFDPDRIPRKSLVFERFT